MKRLFPVIIFLLVSICFQSFAVNYYLSNNGSDTNSGTSPAEPWQTVSQLNGIPLFPGDSVLFLSGNIFRGQINIVNSGTEIAPIYFGTYGGTDPAIISGAETVLNWNVYSGNIYQANFIQSPAHLFANHQQMTIARFPNSGFQIHQGGIGDTSFVDSSLSQPDGYWNGATVRMRTSDRRYETNIVSDFFSSTISLQYNSTNTLENGYGYYFDNLFSELDTTGEWYYDVTNQIVYFYSTDDPNLSVTEASVYDDGIWIPNGNSYIVINHLRFEKQRKAGITLTSNPSFIQVISCKFMLQGERGISMQNGAADCLIQGNEFTDINGQGIGDNTFLRVNILQNTFKRISLVPGYGLNAFNNSYAIVCGNSDSIQVSNNAIDSTGSGGIFCDALNSVFQENILHNTLLTLNDIGAIYCFGSYGGHSDFASNIIRFCHGNNSATPANEIKNAGIYLDASFSNCEIKKSTITDAVNGIWIKDGSSENIIQGNLIYNCSKSQLLLQEGNAMGNTVGNEARGNIFYALSESQEVILLSSPFETFNPVLLDSNYYFNPYNFFAVQRQMVISSEFQDHYYTLSQWRNFYGGDAASKETFFFRSRYVVIDTIGVNLVGNGTFNNNTDGWVNDTPDNLLLLLDNLTPLDNGCMKLVTTPDGPFNFGETYYNGIQVDSGSFYQIGFSCYSLKEGNIGFFQRQPVLPYNLLDLVRYFPFTGWRKNYETVFHCNRNEDGSRLAAHLLYEDSVVWLDNISILKVNAVYQEPLKKSRIFINSTPSPLTFDLLDSVFYDLDQNIVSGQLTVAPYASTVLVFDSSMITIADEPVHIHSANPTLFIYPSITSINIGIDILYNGTFTGSSFIEILDIHGRQVFNERIHESFQSKHIVLPSSSHAGIYFVILHTNQNTFTGKFIIN